MTAFWTLLKRDLVLAMRQGGGGGMSVAFFLIVVSMLPFGIGPDLNLLSRIAPGILWVALLLSALLTLDRLFQTDYEDGSLELLTMGSLPLELVVVSKTTAHWVTTGLPLAVAAPVLGILLNLDAAAFGPLFLTMLVGTPGLNFLGAIGAALTLLVRRGGLLVAILILPLFVPTLIFGVIAVNAVLVGPASFGPPFLILTALSLGAMVLGPIAAAAAIRLALS
ncbi:ABC transporter involved in cytochrome c biogenesis, CcmB subunit [hydrothermal vent metagenome]|uniref:Heme exporter protein B n=1 Tax=hydrothermal vent metagenome TaxID=652676 RepID=A0A3B0S7H6_9ZZZZ